MKHLKRFNEELKSTTYRKVAKKLQDLGHVNRAARVKEHEKFIENRLANEKWKKNIEEYSKWGKIKLRFDDQIVRTIKDARTGKISTTTPKKIFEGEFYILLNFDSFSAEDNTSRQDGDFDFEIPFAIGLIPVDDEVKKLCEENFPDPDIYNGFYWGLWVNIEYKVENERVIFKGLSICPYDEGLTLSPNIVDRRGALLLKKILKAAFDENQDYPSGYTDILNMHDKIFKLYCQDLEMLSDYDFSLDKVVKDIESVPHNTLFKD